MPPLGCVVYAPSTTPIDVKGIVAEVRRTWWGRLKRERLGG
jgi:hypothetical protein